MKIHLISDVHIESNSINYRAPESANIIVLAGDIGEGLDGLIWARNTFPDKQIVYVSGNHEFYGQDLSIIDLMRKTAKSLDIHFLENDEVFIDGVRFLGCTLWANQNNFSLKDIEFSWRNMNDYGSIKAESWWNDNKNRNEAFELMGDHFNKKSFYQKSFSPIIAYLIHKESLSWLTKKLSESHKKTVVVTHHAPSFFQLKDEYIWDDLQYSYCSNLIDLIRSNSVDFWLHGHIHQSVDYGINNTRIISNSAGYKGQKTGFNAELLIYIDSDMTDNL
mgnify:CR=1 FL=1